MRKNTERLTAVLTPEFENENERKLIVSFTADSLESVDVLDAYIDDSLWCSFTPQEKQLHLYNAVVGLLNSTGNTPILEGSIKISYTDAGIVNVARYNLDLFNNYGKRINNTRR